MTNKLLGLTAIGCYAIHAGYHVYHGRPEDTLWACHLGALIVGIGILAASTTINGIGVLLLCMGTPLWTLDLANGSPFMPTSLLTHVVALLIGLVAVRRLGFIPGTWWKTTVTLAVIIALSRISTPREANVNVAFAIQKGWEPYFSSHAVYLATMLGTATTYFFIMERALIYWVARGRTEEGQS